MIIYNIIYIYILIVTAPARGGGGGGGGGKGGGVEGRGTRISPNPSEEAKLHRRTLGLIYGFTQRDPPPPHTKKLGVGRG